MIKHSVKKPFTILVAVVVIIALGCVALSGMTADLLPDISLPYIMIVTTYPGASPEMVEKDVSDPIESALSTVDGIKNITSSSSENYSLVTLEFENDTDMDSAMVKIFNKLEPVKAELPDLCGTPSVIEISADMIATSYIGVSYEGKNIYELTDFVSEVVTPAMESRDGVASVTEIGPVSQTVQVEIDEDKVNAINDKLLAKVDSAFADVLKEAEEGKQALIDGQKEIDDGRQELIDGWAQIEDAEKQIADGKTQVNDGLDQVQQGLDQLAANVDSLGDMASGLKTLVLTRDACGSGLDILYYLAGVNNDYFYTGTIERLADDVYATLKEVVTDEDDLVYIDELFEYIESREGYLFGCLPKDSDLYKNGVSKLANLYYTCIDSINTISDAYNTIRQVAGLDFVQLDAEAMDYTEAEGLATEISAVYSLANSKLLATQLQLQATLSSLESSESALDASKEQLESAEAQLDSAQTQIDEGWKTYNEGLATIAEKREEAKEKANVDQLLSIETLATIIYAQNFEMPAGYIDDENDNSWLLKIGQSIADTDELSETVLCNIDGIGDITIGDIANITIIDDSLETYAKLNGEDGIMLAIYKTSTANANTVGKLCLAKAAELEDKYPGLEFTTLMNQGDYIDWLASSVLESMVLGALLAIIILALFLKAVKPVVVVAISMPLSVLVALLCMYFSGITLNMLTLAGLALGVGMLVDNSIVVIENIYRLRGLGMDSASASVAGTKQVAGPIISSTLTTVCVFVPMLFATGLVKQLLTPMALTVSFCLLGSLVIALVMVPAAGSTLLKKSTQKPHKAFDKLMKKYAASLRWCLNHKALPLILSIALLGFSVWQVLEMGVTMLPNMSMSPIEVDITVSEDKTREECYAIADQVTEAILPLENVKTVGAITTGSLLSMYTTADTSGAYYSYVVYVLTEEESPSEETISALAADISEAVKDIDCEVAITTSQLDMSMLFGSGLSLTIYGEDGDELLAISEDIMEIVGQVEGFSNISNGQEDSDQVVHLIIDKNKAMVEGLTVAQIYQEIATKLVTEATSTTMQVDGYYMDVTVKNLIDEVTLENLMDYEFTVSTTDDEGNAVENTCKLSDFATISNEASLESIEKENLAKYIAVTADVDDGYNTTLLTRQLQPLLDEYELPEGYSIEDSGESESTNKMVKQMVKMLALGLLLIYLVMVAQFQSLKSPFIVLFTIPLAFTGGLLGLLALHEQLTIISLMGFMILMGTVVNNGIVFIDYTNQLRNSGMERRAALVKTGVDRMRPILMTALTTILAMAKMVIGSDMSAQMGRGMAIVIMGGLLYATFMTLYIIPIIYDMFHKKPPLNIQIKDEDLLNIPAETMTAE